jgi:hypothetical protein
MVAGKENADEVLDESTEHGKGETPEELLSSPPKVEVLHEKVTKQVIKEGHAQKPSKYSTYVSVSTVVNHDLTMLYL